MPKKVPPRKSGLFNVSLPSRFQYMDDVGVIKIIIQDHLY